MNVKLSSLLLSYLLIGNCINLTGSTKPIILEEISRQRRAMGARNSLKEIPMHQNNILPNTVSHDRMMAQRPNYIPRKPEFQATRNINLQNKPQGVRRLVTRPSVNLRTVQNRRTQGTDDAVYPTEEEQMNQEVIESAPIENGDAIAPEDDNVIELPDEGGQIIDTTADSEPIEEYQDEPVEVPTQEPINENVEEAAPVVEETAPAAEEPAPTPEEETGLSRITEREELKAAIFLIEYKLTEVNALMNECITQEFEADIMAETQYLMLTCTGLTYQILFHNYKEGMRRIKVIFMDLLKRKMKRLDEEYDDEIDFFLDTFEDFIDKDYKIAESLEITKKTVKYYVSPRFYDSLIAIAEPEISALNVLHNRLKVSRKEIQDLLVKKMIERDNYIKEMGGPLQQIKDKIEDVVTDNNPSPFQPEFADDLGSNESDYEDVPEDEYVEEDPGEYDEEEDDGNGEDYETSPDEYSEDSYDSSQDGGPDNKVGDDMIDESAQNDNTGDEDAQQFDENNTD